MGSTLAGIGGQVRAALCIMWLIEVVVSSFQISAQQLSLMGSDNTKDPERCFPHFWSCVESRVLRLFLPLLALPPRICVGLLCLNFYKYLYDAQ